MEKVVLLQSQTRGWKTQLGIVEFVVKFFE